ncbi:MAG: nucleotidyltransferase domain-containing protein [Candidatus Bathyarchaeia archaeon]
MVRKRKGQSVRGLCSRSLEVVEEPYRSLAHGLLQGLLKVFKDRLISFVLYGSVARGDARRDSDLDVLLVVKRLPKSRFKRLDLFRRAEEELEPLLDKMLDRGYAVMISPIMKSMEEALRMSPIYLDMVEDATIVYDKGGFFVGILQRLKERLDELGSERVWVGRRWYWRLKRDFKFGEAVIIK